VLPLEVDLFDLKNPSSVGHSVSPEEPTGRTRLCVSPLLLFLNCSRLFPVGDEFTLLVSWPSRLPKLANSTAILNVYAAVFTAESERDGHLARVSGSTPTAATCGDHSPAF